MLILLWGLETEAPLTAVHRELTRLGIPPIFVNQAEPSGIRVELSVGAEVTGRIKAGKEVADLDAITAAYLRPYETSALSPPEERENQIDDVLSAWSQITDCLVVNRFDAMAANSSKPYQSRWIRNFGFKIPATLVTTDPLAAEEFWQHHQAVIYKSVSSTRSCVARLRPEHRKRLLDVASCPTQFQEYIPGRDHRVHVVGDEVFASELICDADDYRYPQQHPLEIRPCAVPEDIEDRCRNLAADMRLPLAGIDLRRTPEGEWYCFEVNPSPAFTFYEQATGQPLANAIARLLASGGSGSMSKFSEIPTPASSALLQSSAEFLQPIWNP